MAIACAGRGGMRRGRRSRGASSPGTNGNGGSRTPLLFTSCAPEQTFHRELVPDVAITRTGGHCMRRIALIGLALLAMTISASARLGMAPMAAPDGGVIEVKRWARPRPRAHAPGRARAPLRVAQGPRSPQASPSPISLRWIRLSSSHCPGDRRIAAARTGRAPRRGRFSGSPNGRVALSRAPSPPRSGSGPNDSWRRASA